MTSASPPVLANGAASEATMSNFRAVSGIIIFAVRIGHFREVF
jgi:hypothetical protein